MAGTPDPRIGTDLGSYRIEAVIGRGGMGVVYRATDSRLDRRVALKVLAVELADDEGFRQRFLRESRLAASIDDPNIIPVYEAGEAGGVFYLAMRFVDGTDLEARLRAGPLDPATTVHLLAQIASALDAAHEAALVHRDVKPANILIASGKGADRPEHAYLTDFGLTKHRGSQSGATRAGSFLGTLDYIAPEQVEGRPVDGRADEYALACVAYQCLTGAVPFVRDNDAATLMAHLRDAPPAVSAAKPDLPQAADAVIARGMAKAPDDRFPTCSAFAGALRQALGVRPTEERAQPPLDRRRRGLLVAGAAAALVLLAAIALSAWRSGPQSTPGTSLEPTSTADLAAASATVDAGPQSTAFPNVAEAELIAAFDRAGITGTCERGPYGILGSDGSEVFPAPDASVECTLDVDVGASSALIREFPPLGSGAQRANTLEAFVTYFADRVARAPAGDCTLASPAVGTWSIAGEEVGAIVCYTDSTTGDAVMYWSYADARVLVKAINQRGDEAALRRFFEDHSRFLAQP